MIQQESREVLHGLHLRGRISLGTQYARGTAAKPNPMSTCAVTIRAMLCDCGAIAAPTKEIVQVATKMAFRAWKVSEADAIAGQSTA